MTNRETILNLQITSLTDEVTGLDTKIAEIDGASVGHTGLQDHMTEYREKLVANKTSIETMKTKLQTELTTLTNSSFTTPQQTDVDEINTMFPNKYAGKLNKLKCDTDEAKTEFFDMYDAATTDLLKEIAADEGLKNY